MSVMSGFVSWRMRVSHAVKAMPAKGWVAIATATVVVVGSGLLHPALPGFILMGLAASVVMGHEKN